MLNSLAKIGVVMKIIGMLILGFLFCSAANAEPQWCNGLIKHSYLQNDGNLFIYGDWRGQHTRVCNINNDSTGISVETCKGWLSMVLAAKISQTKVVVHYSDVPSCAEIPQYQLAPFPAYIMVSE
jgi:hypothetical protein